MLLHLDFYECLLGVDSVGVGEEEDTSGQRSADASTLSRLLCPRNLGCAEVVELPPPYYDDPKAGITLYHADALEVIPLLPRVDLVLTDPPYGIDVVSAEGTIGGAGDAFVNKYKQVHGDNIPFDPSLVLKIDAATFILWGANYYACRLPDGNRRWLVWDKVRSAGTTFSDCELAWTNIHGVVVTKFTWVWDGYHRQEEKGERYHPTQKPKALMRWCIDLAPKADLILDPYCGSGTTLLAAKEMGRCCIGVEIDEDYCAITVERLEASAYIRKTLGCKRGKSLLER